MPQLYKAILEKKVKNSLVLILDFQLLLLLMTLLSSAAIIIKAKILNTLIIFYIEMRNTAILLKP